MASGKRTTSSTTSPATTTTSSTTSTTMSSSGTKKKLTKSFSSDNNNTNSSNKRCKSKDTATNAKEKKKRHSFSFGFFSDRSSSKQNNNKETENGNNSDQSPQPEKKKSIPTAGGGTSPGSSPKTTRRKNSNGSIQSTSSGVTGNTARSPKLTNKTYRTTNSSFEKAALFGQKEPSFSTDEEDEEESRPITKSHSQSHMVPPTPAVKLHLPVPTILINGEAWDGKTEISDEEEDDEDGDQSTRRSKKGNSTLDHNLFITSNGLIQRGGSMECMAGGKGLRQGFVDTESTFFIETEEPFDTCSLRVEIKGPKQKPIKITTHLLDENLCSFSYWARRVGYYMIGVKWKGEHVVGSPFDVTILAISKSNQKKQ